MGIVIDSSIFIAAERGLFDWIGFHSRIGSEPIFLNVITLPNLRMALNAPTRRNDARRVPASLARSRPAIRCFRLSVRKRWNMRAFGLNSRREAYLLAHTTNSSPPSPLGTATVSLR
ncbi:MAG TPA: hypothetical protein VIT21_10245 [Chthoniobacterales bacterium]